MMPSCPPVSLLPGRLLTCPLSRCLFSLLRPTPGGGPGMLTVVDNRTGKRYEIPIDDHGTIKVEAGKYTVVRGQGQ